MIETACRKAFVDIGSLLGIDAALQPPFVSGQRGRMLVGDFEARARLLAAPFACEAAAYLQLALGNALH